MARISRKSVTALAAAALASGAAGGALAASAPANLKASMNALQVVPNGPRANLAHASGMFRGTLSRSGSGWKLAWRITYRDIGTPIITIADIHRGKPGHFGPILTRLCAQCHSGQQGRKTLTSADVSMIKSGGAFLTIITDKYPNGAIRGQIALVG
jgi:hypothetical protein